VVVVVAAVVVAAVVVVVVGANVTRSGTFSYSTAGYGSLGLDDGKGFFFLNLVTDIGTGRSSLTGA